MKTLVLAAALWPALLPAHAAADAATPVVAVVRMPTPWYAPRTLVVSKMRGTIPLHAQLPGLAWPSRRFRSSAQATSLLRSRL